MQINVRRIPLPWLGTHVLYVEEYLYDEPFERRRRVLLSIEPARGRRHAARAAIHAQGGSRQSHALTADDVESVPGCDLLLKREGGQFRGGTRGAQLPRNTARAKHAGSTTAWSSATGCSGTASAR